MSAVDDYAWQDRAKCLGMDPALFSLDDLRPRPQGKEYQKCAEYLCEGCVVVCECALDALRHKSESIVQAGVWIPTRTNPNMKKITKMLKEKAGVTG